MKREERRLFESFDAGEGKRCVEFLYRDRCVVLVFEAHTTEVVCEEYLSGVEHLCQLFRVSDEDTAIAVEVWSDVGVCGVEKLNLRRLRPCFIHAFITQDFRAPLKIR